jgi:hypothetical protein
MTENKTPRAEPAWFHLDAGAAFRGYHDYFRRWNGWACPYFDLFEAQRLVKIFHDYDGCSATWDGDVIVIVGNDGEEERWEPQTILDSLHYEGRTVWAIGSHSWCWNDIETPEAGRILAFCKEGVEHVTFHSTAFVRELHTLSSDGTVLAAARDLKGFCGPADVDPRGGHAIVFPSEFWHCAECSARAVLLRGPFPSSLTADQQHDIDGVVGGKMDNSHDAGGPDLEEHEAAAAVIYDTVHYVQGVIEDATVCCDGDDEIAARWPSPLSEDWKDPIVDYLRRRYFGLTNDSLRLK